MTIPSAADTFEMLRATEQLTWLAPLDKFKRGYETIEASASRKTSAGDNVDWQYVSGKHLRCKVLSTQQSDKARSSQSASSQTNRFPLSQEAANDRQLRIIVECGPFEEERLLASGSGCSLSHLSSSSTASPLVLSDVDIVRVNRAYFQTEHRLKAVIVYRQNKCVLVRILDERDLNKALRMQLEFQQDEDVETFLSLIELDSTRHNPTRPAEAKTGESQSSSKSKQKLDKTDTPSQEAPNKTFPSRVAEDVPVESQTQSQSQSQGLGEKLLLLNEARQPPATSHYSALDSYTQAVQPESLNVGASAHLCLNCASQTLPGTTFDNATASSPSSSVPLIQLCRPSIETSLTSFTNEEMFGRRAGEERSDGAEYVSDQDEFDDGLQGWPDPSAVECIHDDVCRLCLADPGLKEVIARCVDEYLLDAELEQTDAL